MTDRWLARYDAGPQNVRMLRRTKIVATLGPATDDLEVLRGMCRAGLDVARINFSHGTQEQQRKRLVMLREACRLEGRVVGILGDLAGPKIRIESFRDGPVQLVEGRPFALDTALDPQGGTVEAVGCAYKNLPSDVAPGDTLLLNDGLIVLEVTGIQGTRIDTRVVAGGELSNRKGVNRKGGGISAPALTEKDLEDIRFAAAEQLDYVALSFVRNAALGHWLSKGDFGIVATCAGISSGPGTVLTQRPPCPCDNVPQGQGGGASAQGELPGRSWVRRMYAPRRTVTYTGSRRPNRGTPDRQRKVAVSPSPTSNASSGLLHQSIVSWMVGRPGVASSTTLPAERTAPASRPSITIVYFRTRSTQTARSRLTSIRADMPATLRRSVRLRQAG